MNVLGISSFYHDAAACLIRDGVVVAAASEERFTRKKHDESFPRQAIEYCLSEGKLLVDDLDCIGFYEKPFVKFKRILFSQLATFPRSYASFLRAIPSWLHQKLAIPALIAEELQYDGPVYMIEHHLSHAASAFLVSPFREAALLTVDGVGEWSTATYGRGKDADIDLFQEIRFPHSLGLLYTAVTSYLGFKVNSAEYKVMGLAPYGTPKYEREVRELIDVAEDGSFQLDMDYFAYHYGLHMTNGRFHRLFGGEPRASEAPLEQRHKDIAASVQKVTEDVMLKMARHLHRETGLRNLCLAGGVALNCVANGRIAREGPFDDLFVQPAAGDAGGALGVAAYLQHHVFGQPRDFVMRSAFLGPAYESDEIRAFLEVKGAVFQELAARGPARQHRGGDRRPGGGRLVPGADGVRAARARIAQHPGGPAESREPGSRQSQDQVPRELPTVRSRGAGRARGGVLRAGSRKPLHDARRPDARRTLTAPGHHPRRWLGARTDGGFRDEPAVSRSAARVRRGDRDAGADQHVVQRAR